MNQLAYTRHQRIVALRDIAQRTFLDLGKELYEFEQEQAYLVLDYPSFRSYLASPEVDIPERSAYRMIRVFQAYNGIATVASLTEVGISKLDMIASHVNENNVNDWLAKASTLSRQDLHRELDHKPLRKRQYRCPECGKVIEPIVEEVERGHV